MRDHPQGPPPICILDYHLHVALLGDDEPAIRRLYSSGVDFQARTADTGGRHSAVTALHLARTPSIITFLTQVVGLDPNAMNVVGKLPLHCAMEALDLERVTALLKAGADPNLEIECPAFALDELEETDPEWRIVGGHFEAPIKEIWDCLEPWRLEILSCWRPNFDPAKDTETLTERKVLVLRALLTYGARLSEPSHGEHPEGTPLIEAVKFGEIAMVEELLRWNVEDSVCMEAVDGWLLATAYRWALRTGNEEIAALLLRHGADPESVTGWGRHGGR